MLNVSIISLSLHFQFCLLTIATSFAKPQVDMKYYDSGKQIEGDTDTIVIEKPFYVCELVSLIAAIVTIAKLSRNDDSSTFRYQIWYTPP